MEVRNRFKGLDLIDRVPDEYGWRFMTLYRRRGSRPSPLKKINKYNYNWEKNKKNIIIIGEKQTNKKTIPMEEKCKKAK